LQLTISQILLLKLLCELKEYFLFIFSEINYNVIIKAYKSVYEKDMKNSIPIRNIQYIKAHTHVGANKSAFSCKILVGYNSRFNVRIKEKNNFNRNLFVFIPNTIFFQ